MKRVIFSIWVGLGIFRAICADAVPIPGGELRQWEAVPVEAEGGENARMVLNGLWRFQPGDPARAAAEPEDVWGWVRVPGSWHRRPDWNAPGVVADGDSPLWRRFVAGHRSWPLGWMEREVQIPADWAGRRVWLELSELSTEARIFLDEEWVGEVRGDRARLELTDQIRPGQVQRLRLQIAAVPPDRPSLFLQGETEEQVELRPAELTRFGLSWDVMLVSGPQGPRLDALRLETSVREARLTVRGVVAEAAEADVTLTVRVWDGDALLLEHPVALQVDAAGGFSLPIDWMPERLWDVADPHLLVAEVAVAGEGIADTRRIRFGFREFRLEGTTFLLNEIPIRLRPLPNIDMPHMPVLAERVLEGKRSLGGNLVLMHADLRQEIFIEAADRVGMLVFAEVPEIKEQVFQNTWAAEKAEWDAEMRAEVARYYNHPSVVGWWSGFNVFANGEDQNPARLGRFDELRVENPLWESRVAMGQEAMDLMRAADPTRVVYSHNGSVVGDFQTTNTYLNLIPLQEREEWLSHWAAEGEVPFLAIEFGTPLNCSYMQGKLSGGWGSRDRGAVNSAAMLTEYAAIYFGPEAYRREEARYREAIRRSHREGFIHNYDDFHGWESIDEAPNQQAIQALFHTNTLRTWRTWGTTGGMNHWGFLTHGWRYRSWRRNLDPVDLGPFVPGTRGIYRQEIGSGLWNNVMPGGYERLAGGDAFVANHGDVLAWIAGDATRGFTDKRHHYVPRERLTKQVVLINDRRTPQRFDGTWRVRVDGEQVAVGSFSVQVPPASEVFQALGATMPFRGDRQLFGEVLLEVDVAGQMLEDRFPFTVYPDLFEPVQVMLLGDGGTHAALSAAKVTVLPWDPNADAGKVLVTGRGAWESGEVDPAALMAWVSDGGRLLISSPHPDWLRETVGLRVAPHLSRRAFPASHPAMAGLTDVELRDWNGTTTTVAAYPEYSHVLHNHGDKPLHGWRWGNRHSVSSGMVEIPHHSGWRPLLVGEFDLAYSPLMELEFGKGRVVLSTLDLEDNLAEDPAARLLTHRLLDWLHQAPDATPRGGMVYWGQENQRQIFDDAGAEFADVPESARVVVLGRNHRRTEAEIQGWLMAGQNVLVLRGAELPAFTGWAWDVPGDHHGSTSLPEWPETAGLTLSSLHTRAPYPYWTLLGEGAAADGLLARHAVQGGGVLLATGLDPTWLRTDQQPFLRMTRWKQTRLWVSLAAELGVCFELDRQIFEHNVLPTGHLALAGDWEGVATLPLPAAETLDAAHPDPGITDAARRILEGGEAEWRPYPVPGTVQAAHPDWRDLNGEFLLRRTVKLPEAWAGQPLHLALGVADDFDTTFWNGTEVGATGIETPHFWAHPRVYTIPGEQVRAGRHTLTVRLFDRFGDGGLLSPPGDIRLINPAAPRRHWYHSDYRTDFPYGDDPYRYYRW